MTEESPPLADTPDGARWWAQRCTNYGGLERAFNEAADEIERLEIECGNQEIIIGMLRKQIAEMSLT